MTPPRSQRRRGARRFTERLIVYVTPQMMERLTSIADDTERSIPEVVRSYIRIGVARELDLDADDEGDD